MNFNRELYKEAFKQGYKKAKTLNEDVGESGREYQDFFRKLLDVDDNIEGEALLYDKRGIKTGGLYKVFCDSETPTEIEIYDPTTGDIVKTFDVSDIDFIEPSVSFHIGLKDGTSVVLAVFQQLNAKDLGIV